jgi:hypothetical protein
MDEAEEAVGRVRDEHAAGRLPSPGAGDPFVAATTIEGGGRTSA